MKGFIVFVLTLVTFVHAEAPISEYLPPGQEAAIEIAGPSNEYLVPAVEGATVLSNDGYRYKTVHRFRNRKRRDVSELPGAEYLPPVQESGIAIAAPSNEYLVPAVEGATVLSNDGYRYKTVHRFRNRKRRDVSELPGAEYLPPVQESGIAIAAPSNEYLVPAVEGATVLSNDGYRYKTVRRFRNRKRRDVSELPGAEYLPPVQDAGIEIAAPSNAYLAPTVEGATVLSNDGYRYKTVRRFRNRKRRDVSELTGFEYLPPNQQLAIKVAGPSNEYLTPGVDQSTFVANDGYRYKAVKKFKVKRH